MTDDLFSGPRWSRRKITVVLYPFAAAAVAINLFMASLVTQVIGLPALPPVCAWPVGAAWRACRDAVWPLGRGLLDEAAE